jgi:hypothetical protein
MNAPEHGRDPYQGIAEALHHLKQGEHELLAVVHTGSLHSFVDFNLQIPANALLFLLQAYLLTSPPLPSETMATRVRRRTENPASATAPALNGSEI